MVPLLLGWALWRGSKERPSFKSYGMMCVQMSLYLGRLSSLEQNITFATIASYCDALVVKCKQTVKHPAACFVVVALLNSIAIQRMWWHHSPRMELIREPCTRTAKYAKEVNLWGPIRTGFRFQCLFVGREKSVKKLSNGCQHGDLCLENGWQGIKDINLNIAYFHLLELKRWEHVYWWAQFWDLGFNVLFWSYRSMFSPCLCGFYPPTPASSHIPKTRMLS